MKIIGPSLLAIVAFILTISIDSVKSTHDDHNSYPKLLHMTPRDHRAVYELNQRDSLTNKVKTGWIVKQNEPVDFIVYIAVLDHIKSMDELGQGFIYFTTNIQYCDYDNSTGELNTDDQSELFPLKYMRDRTKFALTPSSETGRVVKRSQASNEPWSTLIVAEFTLKLKYSANEYYSCLHVGTKKSPDSDLLRFVHQGNSLNFTHIITTKDLLPLFLVIIFYLVLLCFSALCSGLNLGLMSLDLTELNILKKIGNTKEKKYAQKIYPLREKGNRLLCTILLGNVLVNSTSTLILGSYLEGIFAAIGSTLLIVIFGEIIPQAVCSRHGLAIGAYTRHVTYGMMIATFVLAYPLGKILDFFLGKEIAATFSRDKVRELMLQAKQSSVGIKDEQFKFIEGALDFKSKCVKDIMVPLRDVFSLDINSILDFETFKTILYHGYSRIPVYEHTPENFVGMILIQDLLLNDPADRVPLRAVMEFYKHKVPKCKQKDSLESMFDKFRKGDSHMAFVYSDDANFANNEDESVDAVGIVTLENIIETLVQSEIMDESDKKREKRRNRARNFLKGKLGNVSLSNENLNIFVEEDKINRPLISSQIRKALFYFLSSTVKPFTPEFINPRLLETFLRQPELIIEKRNLSQVDNDKNMYLYEYGVPCDYFIIILDGNATVQVGKEGMEIAAGLFSYYGIDALKPANDVAGLRLNESLLNPNPSSGTVCLSENDLSSSGGEREKILYVPEFSLIVNSYCVYLKVTRSQWADAVTKSMVERYHHGGQPAVQIANEKHSLAHLA